MPHITRLINRWKENDEYALDHLIQIAYSRLHTSARQAIGFYGNNASIQSTELVSELYLHFRQQKVVRYHSAKHFFAIATLKLRQILSTRFEKKTAKKRDYGYRECASVIDNSPSEPSTIEMLILNNSLEFLESVEPVNARIAELKLFWEFDNSEIAEILGVSESTVGRKWKIAKALIAKRMKENDYALH